jgi:hypothetical protein
MKSIGSLEIVSDAATPLALFLPRVSLSLVILSGAPRAFSYPPPFGGRGAQSKDLSSHWRHDFEESPGCQPSQTISRRELL